MIYKTIVTILRLAHMPWLFQRDCLAAFCSFLLEELALGVEGV